MNIDAFVRLVQQRTETQALLDAGELGRCEECGKVTADKDADGEWVCEACCETEAEFISEQRYNDNRRF